MNRRRFFILALSVFFCTSLPAALPAKAGEEAVPVQDQKKVVPAGGDSRVHFLYRGRKMDLPIASFRPECKGYSQDGIKYATPAGVITVAWKDIDFILPHWQEGWLIDGKNFTTDVLLPAFCPAAHMSQVTKKTVKVKVKGREKEKVQEEEVRLPLSEIQIVAFDKAGLEKGLAELGRKGVQFEPETGMELVQVKGGCFDMGDTFDEAEAQENEKEVHKACVSDFAVGKTEVTQHQWQIIMGSNKSFFNTCDSCPVENVSWFEAQDFIRILNQKTGKTYRLPTEAEWEYAARSGGKKEKYAGTSSIEALGEFAWYTANTAGHTSPVAMKRPNKLGLFDMSGNVSEWVADRYAADYYGHSPKNNPPGPELGDHRVNRGGSWTYYPVRLRASFRDHDSPSARRNNLGFRLALPVR